MSESSSPARIVLTLSCPDRMGIVAAVSQFLFANGCDIVDSAQFGDREKVRFFLRITFAPPEELGLHHLNSRFAKIAADFGMDFGFYDATARTRALVMVSRFGHCLHDLIYRVSINALPIEIPLVVSNHTDFEDAVGTAGIPFQYLPVTKDNKLDQEAVLYGLIEEHNIDLVVLARYMQVLSNDFCKKLPGRIINIHHSFLPSFKGARPYHQAYERGVKLIGATAHYVTPDLDEGPIIEQEVERVTHSMSGDDFVAVGRDIESVVLARAVKWHAEHRVLPNGNRTIVFP